jgi:Ca-activated chloride channel family protein
MPRRSPSRFAFLLVLLAFAAPAAGEPPPAEKTLSPYFFVEGGDPALDRFPLESTAVDFTISGPIAEVRVTQVYANQGQRPIHARYVFPASTRAAVNGLRMRVRDQVVEAEIQEKKQAKKTFEKAKKAGHNAALLEQQRPNVFSMSVANVMPGDTIEVTLEYTELLVPTEGRYEFVFPTVVGPRYGNDTAKEAPEDDWIANPMLRKGVPTPATWSLSGVISTALPLQEVVSPTHALAGAYESPDLYRFSLEKGEAHATDRDFVLAYRLAGDAIQSGLSLYEAGDEKYFLLQVEPPARVAASAVPPREYVFVIDVSGSMRGFPLSTAKALLRELVEPLRPVDKFNVLMFSGGSRLLSAESLPGTAGNIRKAIAFIDGEPGGGGTELVRALRRALALSPEPGLARSFVILTDGYVSADREAIELVTGNLGAASFFAFGIGSSVNRFLIEGLARAGRGEPFVLLDRSKARETAERFAAYVSTPVLTDVRVDFEGFDTYDTIPRTIPDVLAERPVIVFGKWRGELGGVIDVTGRTGGDDFWQRFEVDGVAPRVENGVLPQLWARERIAALSDYGLTRPDDATRREITKLGLEHALLTRYTSFVAVAKRFVNPGGAGDDVTQPLPLPKGVPETAVGLAVGAEPELGVLVAALMLLSLGPVFARARRRVPVRRG